MINISNELLTACIFCTFIFPVSILLKRFYACVEKTYTTSGALNIWREANPGLYVGDSSYARVLVINAIEAYKAFLSHHPLYSFSGFNDPYVAYLLSLLDEHGPEPPRKPYPKMTPKRVIFYTKNDPTEVGPHYLEK